MSVGVALPRQQGIEAHVAADGAKRHRGVDAAAVGGHVDPPDVSTEALQLPTLLGLRAVPEPVARVLRLWELNRDVVGRHHLGADEIAHRVGPERLGVAQSDDVVQREKRSAEAPVGVGTDRKLRPVDVEGEGSLAEPLLLEVVDHDLTVVAGLRRVAGVLPVIGRGGVIVSRIGSRRLGRRRRRWRRRRRGWRVQKQQTSSHQEKRCHAGEEPKQSVHRTPA